MKLFDGVQLTSWVNFRGIGSDKPMLCTTGLPWLMTLSCAAKEIIFFKYVSQIIQSRHR